MDQSLHNPDVRPHSHPLSCRLRRPIQDRTLTSDPNQNISATSHDFLSQNRPRLPPPHLPLQGSINRSSLDNHHTSPHPRAACHSKIRPATMMTTTSHATTRMSRTNSPPRLQFPSQFQVPSRLRVHPPQAHHLPCQALFLVPTSMTQSKRSETIWR